LTRLKRELSKEKRVKDGELGFRTPMILLCFVAGLDRYRDVVRNNKAHLEQTMSMLEDSEAKITLLKMQIAKIEQQQYQSERMFCVCVL
jgi:hypothetical protein